MSVWSVGDDKEEVHCEKDIGMKRGTPAILTGG